ncbi:MAG: hypothetical protein IPP58_07150 [Holophagaceae bacterium]|uniref:Uncharacterized protein n=1 Tax=Candidatus Geothrix skivensis TaxID=2954439 RepID=A0A9D7SGW9_9BACT|nr:hypothetical protein [Candidatus Geothrix skivensis]
MADGSWDNGGHGVPAKAGLPLWGKIALGCGIAFLVVLVTCVGGVAYLGNRITKDPEGFGKKIMGMGIEKIGPDWQEFRAVVEQLRSPEGCQALYAANPALAKTWPTQAAFLEASSRWHKEVVSAPELTPELMTKQGLRINYEGSGRVSLGWSPQSGRAVYVTFEGTRKPGDRTPRQVVELDVR